MHPTVDTRDMLASDRRDNVSASHLCNHTLGRFEMSFAHNDDICDNRDYTSSLIRDLRDGIGRRNREYGRMSDPQLAIKEWLRARLDEKPHGFKSKLAKAMGISSDMLTKITETEDPRPKKRRQIKPHEFEPMARFLGALPPGYEAMKNWLDGSTVAAPALNDSDAKIALLRQVFEEIPKAKRPAALAALTSIHAQEAEAEVEPAGLDLTAADS